VGIEQWPEKKIKLEEEANSKILVTDTDSGNQVWRLAMWKTIFRRKKKRNNDSSKASLSRSHHNKHWPAKSPTNPPALPSVFSEPKKRHTVHQM